MGAMAKRPRQAGRQDDRMFLNSILENIPNMIFVKDATDLRFVLFNKAGEELLGMRQDELVGKNDYDFFPKKEADFFTKKDRAVLRRKKLLDIPEEPIHTKKKGIRILHTKKIPLMSPWGKKRYLLGISEDITARKNAEEALRKAYEDLEDRVQKRTRQLSLSYKALRESEERYRNLSEELEQKVDRRTSELKSAVSEIEAFSYSVSHDLRAPLRAIEGFSEILLEEHADTLTAEGKRLLQIVRKNTLHMSQLIDDLLAFSRIARKDFVKRRVPMDDLARLVSEDLHHAHPATQVSIPHLPDAFGDAPLLRQVWTNLLSNAFKFSRHNPDASIEMGAEEKANEIIYRIRDNGVGFDMQYVDKLFGVFQRLHNLDEFEGTGVGLAIVQRIIHKHGGQTWAEGKLNEGATFYFSLPKMEAS
jgi:PAS domain S-box-containing protein